MVDWAWGQFALVGWAAACLFAAGARAKGIQLTRRTVSEIAQAVVIVVFLFALLTDGSGCSSASTTADTACLLSADTEC